MKKGLLFSASILALGVSPSFAQTAGSVSKAAAPQAVEQAEVNQNSNNNIFKLGEIAVSVVDDTTQVGSRTTVTAEEISAYTDSNTLEKALNLLPSVTETQVGRRNEKSVSIRGFEMRQIAVMIDGVQSAMPYDYYPDLQTYTTGSLSEIQVSKGLSSVLAGPNTMGGIINMVTKRPEKEIEGNLTVTAKFGNSGAYNGILTSGNVGTNQGDWYLQAGATYNDINRWSVSDNYSPVQNTGKQFYQGGTPPNNYYFPLVNENGGFRDGSSSQAEAANIKLGFTPNETDEYVIAYNYSNMEYDIPVYAGQSFIHMSNSGGTRPNGDEKSAYQLTKPFYRSYPYYRKQTVYSLTNTALGDTGYVKTRLFYDTFKNRMDSVEFANADLTEMRNESGFPSLFNDYDFGGSVETGADLIKDNTTKIAFHYRKDVHRSKKLLSNDDWARNVDDTYSVALENTWHANDKTDVIIGASYDWLRVANVKNEKDIKDYRVEDDTFNPMAAVRYRYSDDGAVYAGVAQKSRFATQKSRFGTRTGNGTGIPNPDLKAEKAVNYEIGVSDTVGNVTFDAAAFYTDVRDTNLEVVVEQGGNAYYQTQNFGKSRVYGLELASVINMADSFDLGLAYTYMEKELRSSVAKAEDLKPTNVPKHKLTVYGDWRVAEGLNIIPKVEAYSSRYSTIGGNNMINAAVRTHSASGIGTGVGKQDGTKIGGFATAGLKVKYQPFDALEISAGVDNIFDKNYQLAEGYPEEGRNYFLTLTTKF